MPLTRALKATTTGATDRSYAQVQLAATPDETFWEYYAYIPAASLTAWAGIGFGPDLLTLRATGYGAIAQAVSAQVDFTSGGEGWTWCFSYGSPADSMVTVSPDTWTFIQVRTKESTAEAFLTIDGTPALTGDLVNGPPDIRCVQLGNFLANFTGSDVYITGFKAGSTLGGSDLFDGEIT